MEGAHEAALSVLDYVHAHPEGSGEEHETAAFLCEFLSSVAPPTALLKDVGGTASFMAVYTGHKVRGSQRTTVLRCELDALRSSSGVAHLCGHDGHMAIMCGVATLLAAHRESLATNTILLFQAAEETGQGARLILKDDAAKSLLKSAEAAYALHNIPGEEMGTVLCRPGVFTCSVVSADIRITGRQCHAAEPESGSNPASGLPAFLAWLAAQQEPDCASPDYTIATVVHVGVGSPGKYGVSPGSGLVGLTIRSRKRERLEALQAAIEAQAAEAWAGTDYTVSTKWKEHFKSIENTERGAERIAAAVGGLTSDRGGPTALHRMEAPFSWGEDFSEILDVVGEGAMFGVGSGREQPPLHHHNYAFPEAAIWRGLEVFWALVGPPPAPPSSS